MRSRDIAVVVVALLLFVVLWYQEETVQFSPHCAFYDVAEVEKTRAEHNGMAAPALRLRTMPPKPIVLSYTFVPAPGSAERKRKKTLLIHAGLSNAQRTKLTFTELTPVMAHKDGDTLGTCVPPERAGKTHDFHSRVIGLATGKVHYTIMNKVAYTNVAVVTANYELHLMTPEGEKLWSMRIAPPECYTHADFATVAVVPESVNKDDNGVVAVAMPAVDANGVSMMLYAAFNAGDGAVRWRYLSDSGSDLDDVIREADKAETGDLWEAELFKAGNTTTAVEKKDDAEARPRGPAGIQQVKPKESKAFPVPPVQRHFEQPWTTYRQAVISALPHRFAHIWDAELRPHIFYRTKSRKVTGSRNGPRQSTMTFFHQDRLGKGQRQVLRMAEEDYGVLGERMAAWEKQLQAKAKQSPTTTAPRGGAAAATTVEATTPANTLVFHGPQGIEAIHLYTGNIVTSLQPLKSMHTVYDDINDDYYIEAISTKIGARMATHSVHGVDMVRDCLATIETGVPVAEELLLNVTICDSAGFLGNLDGLRQFLYGHEVEDGGDGGGAIDTLALFGSENIVDDTTESAVPLVVQTHTRRGAHVVQVERLAVFLLDSGLVTSVDPLRRRVRWRVQTMAEFTSTKGKDKVDAAEHKAAEEEASGVIVVPAVLHKPATEEVHGTVSTFPHLVAYHPFHVEHEGQVDGDAPMHHRYGGSVFNRMSHTSPYVIALGESHLSIISSKKGRVVQHVPLPSPPVAPALLADVTGDGILDIIVLGAHGLYVIAGSTDSQNSQGVAALVGLMLLLLVLLFVAREVNLGVGADGAAKGAATLEDMDDDDDADDDVPVQTIRKPTLKRPVKRSTD